MTATAPAGLTAQCAKHPDRPAVAPCDRCGTFACVECLTLRPNSVLGDQRRCPNCIALEAKDLPPLQLRAQLAKLFLFVCLGLELAESATSLIPGELGEVVQGLAAIGYLVVFIVSAVFFCRWFHLAVRHSAARGVAVGYTPGMAVGSWFIPFVNLVRPFQIARTMLGGESSKVGAWQALWILGNVAGNLSARVDNPAVSIASGLLMAGAAFAATQVVEAITSRTEQPVST